jgi:hypothetical protein
MARIHILVAPRPQWALSCLKVEIIAWTRQDITTTDLAGAVRLAVNRGVKLETINDVLGDVGLRWDTPAATFGHPSTVSWVAAGEIVEVAGSNRGHRDRP